MAMLKLFLLLQFFSANVFDSMQHWGVHQLPIPHNNHHVLVNPHTLQTYQIDNKSKFSLLCDRSTEYGDYNNGAFYFYYRDTLFFYGGFSQYRNHGLLNYLDIPTCSWENVQASHLPFASYPDWVYYDSIHAQLYIVAPKQINLLTKTEQRAPYVYVFDLPTRKAKILGAINEELLPLLEEDWIRVPSPDAFLHLININSQTSVQLHFKANDVALGLFEKVDYQTMGSFKEGEIWIEYLSTTPTYILNNTSSTHQLEYKSLKFSNDLLREESKFKRHIKLYKEPTPVWLYFIISGFLILGVAFLFLKKKHKVHISESEKKLLSSFIVSDKINTQTINEILGLHGNQDGTIDTKRAASIKNLKSYLSAKYKLPIEEVIIETRDESDNRYKYYTLHPKVVKQAEKKLW
jgi:hypothetical protein